LESDKHDYTLEDFKFAGLMMTDGNIDKQTSRLSFSNTNSKIYMWVERYLNNKGIHFSKSIYQKLIKDKLGIAQINQDNQYLQVNSKNCLISTSKNKLIGLVDVENLAIIDTPDGLLICNMSHDGSAKVRDIVNQIVKNKKYHQFFLKKQ
jgi:hypothetical protein